MLIYISSTVDSKDKDQVEVLKTILQKDGHEFITFHDIKNKYPNQNEKFYINGTIGIINTAPIDMIIFMPGWEKDKKSNAEIMASKNMNVTICEYRNKLIHKL